MIILGDSLIACEEFNFITAIEDIKDTKANCVLLFAFDMRIAQYCKENNLNSAIYVSSIKEAIYVNALESTYIISNKTLSSKIQKIADNYMFDAKNIAIISSNDEFEEIATLEIDGIIYEDENIKNIQKNK